RRSRRVESAAARSRPDRAGRHPFPRVSRSLGPEDAARRSARDPRRGAAVPPAHATLGEAVLGSDEQLRPARLGLGRSGLSLSAGAPGNRPALARDAAEPHRGLGRIAPAAPPPEACLINLYDA